MMFRARDTATAKQAAPALARGEVRVRLEGAPWLSLRDRCGAQPRRRGSSRAAGWLSLSRLEVAMVVVLLTLLAAVFQGVRRDPRLALSAPEAPPPVSMVSLID